MRLAALLVLFSIPLLEIGVLVKIGQSLGLWMTLAIVFATAILGAAVIANQGFNAPFRMQDAIRRGETPIATMFDGALIWFAGFLLLTPGFIADGLGLLLLVPPIRRVLSRWIAKQFFGMADVDIEVRTSDGSRSSSRRWSKVGRPGDASGSTQDAPRGNGQGADPGNRGPVIEGEFERLGERTIDPNRRRPDEPSKS